MYCNNCGIQNADTAKFCKACGTKLALPPAPQPQPPKSKRLYGVVVVAILALLGIGGVFAAWNFGLFAETAETAAQSWQTQYDLGVRYMEDGDYEEAIIAFIAAIEIDPKQPEAYITLADAYVAQGDIARAIDILEDGYANTADERIKEKQVELESLNSDEEAEADATPDETLEVEEPTPTPTPDRTDEFRAIYQAFVYDFSEEDCSVNTYQFADLNQDGIEEMLLVINVNDSIQPGNRYVLYTLVDEIVTELDAVESLMMRSDNYDYKFVTLGAENEVYLLETYYRNGWSEYGQIYTLYTITEQTLVAGESVGTLSTYETIEGYGTPYAPADANSAFTYVYYLVDGVGVTPEQYELYRFDNELIKYEENIFYD